MFTIDKLKITGFRGFGISKIDVLEITKLEQIFIILGRNGCGKTRFMSIVFPVAPVKVDWHEGGGYVNQCTVNGVQYRFSVKLKGESLKCSIYNVTEKKDVVRDVNPKVYSERAVEIHGIDKDLKDLLSGKVSLTRMSTSLRRKWFTRLSTHDMQYALAYYNRLRERHRDLNGVLRYTQSKIADIKPRVLETDEERKILAQAINGLKSEVDEIALAAQSITSDRTITKEQFVRTVESLNNVSVNIMRTPTPNIVDVDDVRISIETTVGQLARLDEQIVNADTRLMGLREAQDRHGYVLSNTAGLETAVARASEVVEQFDIGTYFYKELFAVDHFRISGIRQALNYVNEFSNNFNRWVDGLAGTETLEESGTALGALRAEVSDVEFRLGKVNSAIEHYSHKLKHLHDTEAVDCPSCNTHFKPGWGATSEEEITKELDSLSTVKTKGEARLHILRTELVPAEEQYEYRSAINSVINEYRRDPVLMCLFNTLEEKSVLTANRGQFSAYVTTFVDELSVAIQFHTANNEYVKKNDELQELRRLHPTDGIDYEKDLLALQDNRDHLATARQVTANRLNEFRLIVDRVEEYARLEAEYLALVSRHNRECGELKKNIELELLTTARAQIWERYSVATAKLSEMEDEIRRLEALEAEATSIAKQVKAAQLLVTRMSPEKGLLRKYFYRSILRITDMMTQYIGRVIEYPMVVKGCNLEETDLDYKFPFNVADVADDIPDVSDGSTAQRDIIDLAFVLTVYKALSLRGYPLLLDEPGSGFDEGHRNTLTTFIKALVDKEEVSQILVISHNSDVHSRLTGADFCVLMEDGVSVPTSYNKNVSITLGE